MKKQYFANVTLLTRFIIKRDKWRLLIWVSSFVFFNMIVAIQITNMYPTQVERDSFKLVMDNPAMIAMFGEGYGIDTYTQGAFWAHMMYLWVGLFVAVMAIMLVARNLRAEEESGHYELIRSFPVGRDTYLLATLLVMIGTFLLLGITLAIGMSILGLEDIDFVGSLNFGFGLAFIGVFFTSISAVLAQLYQSNRTVMSASFLTLLAIYIIFSIGAVSSEVVMWLSPFKWMIHSQPYVNNLGWPLLLLTTLSIGLGILALYLSSIRDLDAGFFTSKRGKETIAKYAKGPFGFYLRLGKTQLIIWAFGMFILGTSYGSIFGDLEAYLENNSYFEEILPNLPGIPLAVQFMGFIMVVLGMVSMIPAIMSMNKLAQEERKNRSELLMSHPVSRFTTILSHFALAFITGIIMLFMSAIGLYSASMPVMDDPIAFTTFLSAIMVYVPTLIMMLGVSSLIAGFTPYKTWIVWVFMGYSFFVSYLGQLLDLWDVLEKLTPFGYIPKLPVDDMNWLTQIIIIVIGLGLAYIGYNRYQNRDIKG